MGEGDFETADRLLETILADRRFASRRASLEADHRRIHAELDDLVRTERRLAAEEAYWTIYESALVHLAARDYERAIKKLEDAGRDPSLAPLGGRPVADARDVRLVLAGVYEAALENLVASTGEVSLRRRSGSEVPGRVVKRIAPDEISVGGATGVARSVRMIELVEDDLVRWAGLSEEEPEDRLVLGLFRLYEGNDLESARRALAGAGRPELAALSTLRALERAAASQDWTLARELASELSGADLPASRAAGLDELSTRIDRELSVQRRLEERLAGKLLRSGGGRVTIEYSFEDARDLADWTEVVRKLGPADPADRAWRIGAEGLAASPRPEDRILAHVLPFRSPIRVEIEWISEPSREAGFEIDLAADPTFTTAAVYRATRFPPTGTLRAILSGLEDTAAVQRDVEEVPRRFVATLAGGEQILTLGQPLRRAGSEADAQGRLGLAVRREPCRIRWLLVEADLAEGWEGE